MDRYSCPHCQQTYYGGETAASGTCELCGETGVVPTDSAIRTSAGGNDHERSSPLQSRASKGGPFREFYDQFLQVKTFCDTRRLVLQGERLFDWTPEQRAQRRIMGPWAFNIYETALASIPTLLLLKVCNFLWPIPSAGEFDELFESVIAFFSPLILPVMTLLFSWIACRACLRTEDSTPANRRRAQFAYLYYDGAHGLIAQTLAVLGYSLMYSFLHPRPDLVERMGMMIFLLLAAVTVIAVYYDTLFLTLHRVPNLLFDLNSYERIYFIPRRRKKTDSQKRPRPPRGCIPIMWLGFAFVGVAVTFGIGVISGIITVLLFALRAAAN